MMEIKKIDNQAEWDGWLKAEDAPFTQSWAWGEILISEGKKVERLAVIEDGKIKVAAQIVFNRALGFNYAFCPKGPVVKNFQIPNSNFQIVNYLKSKGCIFFRVEPSVILSDNEGSLNSGRKGFFTSFRMTKTIDVNPRATTVLALDDSEEGLLQKMHAKTRYNIHLAEKKDLKISEEKNFEIFWNLMQETGRRDDFRLHEKKHYEAIFASPFSHQLTAFQNGKPAATMVYVSFGNTTTYLFGGSDYEHRQLMAPYLLQWEAIKFAKKQGNKFYDFFGVAPRLAVAATDKRSEYRYDEKHQYAGVTRFKLGFGGESIERPGTFDLIISPFRYRMYKLLRELRRLA